MREQRRGDGYVPPEFGEAGAPKEVKNFDTNVGVHVIRAADKRLHGEAPYENERGSKPTIDRSTGQRRSE